MIDIVVNPNGGKGTSLAAFARVKAYLDFNDMDYSVNETKGPGDAVTIVQKLCSAGSRKIAVIGGDGTFHEALNGMDFTTSRLGFIPAGRGNDFASALGIPSDPVEALKAILAGEELDLDYMQVGKHRCLNICGTGLDVEVLRLAEKSKGKFAYTAALVKCLLNYKPYQIEVTVNGKTKEYSCITVAVCNGSQFGGGIKICPNASPRDGLLDLVIVTKPKQSVFLVMPGFIKGKHIGKGYTIVEQCEEVTIKSPQVIQLDGEIYEENVLATKIVKGGLKTFKF